MQIHLPLKVIKVIKVICLGLVFAAFTFAQDTGSVAKISSPEKPAISIPGPAPLTKAFSIHPVLSVAIRGLHVSYEAAFRGGKNAFEVPLYLGYSESSYDNPSFFLGTGFGIRRYLLTPGAGTYVSPQVEVLNLHRFAKGTLNESNQIIIFPTLRMGYKWRWNSFILDVGAGAGYVNINKDGDNRNAEDDPRHSLFPFGNVAAGIPF